MVRRCSRSPSSRNAGTLRIGRRTALFAEIEPPVVEFERGPQDRTPWIAGGSPGVSRDSHATVVPGRFLRRNFDHLDPRGQATPCLSVRPASRPCVRGICRQPGSCRPGNSGCGGARAKGLKAGVAGSARRSRCARICLITAGSSMLAITFTAPPQCSQFKMSISNTRFKRCAHVIETWRAGAGSLAVSALRRPRRAGVTCSRNRCFGAKTP